MRAFTVGILVAAVTTAACAGPAGDEATAPDTSPPVVATTASTLASPAATTATTATTASATSLAAVSDATGTATERDFSEVDRIVTEFVTDRELSGAGLVVVDAVDGIVHERYWGTFGPDRVSLVASSSKQITAGVLLHLQDEGLLDMGAPVVDAVDWGRDNPDITPAQLVSSRSGLVGLLPNPIFAPYLCQFAAVGDLETCAASIFTSEADDDDVVPPDTEFRYGGGQWQVAGGLAEAVSGRTWADLIDEVYVQPCGVTSLGYGNHFGQFGAGFAYPEQFDGDPSVLEATDNPNMEGGAYLTAPDYARLLLMHLRGGRCGDAQVLSASALELMHTDHLAPLGLSALPGLGYGMGWWIDRATGRLTDPGAYGSVPWLDLDDGYGAYLVIERDTATGNELAGLLFGPVEAAVRGG